MKIMTIPVTPTNSPRRARRKRVSKRTESLRASEIREVSGGAVVAKVAMNLVRFHFQRIRLHHKIAGRARHAVLVRSVVNHRRSPAKVVMGWRRRGSPFERGRFPGIIAGLLAVFHAPKEVEEKYELSRDGNKGDVGDELLEAD